ncbi:helix-turn-helix transcriptional regulator [Cryobacterium sp. GrIS_2_6]|uniref:helix-turn-helix domain-containing protein n=1 Tax=Cryobacterium sp. GrIS_2_6 TaxID=3162785 RepID=UPI002E07FDF8|nr:DNA-binding Xre family transcriptional regulator [Cryobacterium psychrotolerans]
MSATAAVSPSHRAMREEPMLEHAPRRSARIAEEIRGEMEYQGRTLKELSAATGISMAILRRRLTGEKSFYVEELERICRYLNISVIDLIERTEL